MPPVSLPMLENMPKKLIIAALCARPFAQAAAMAGHEVTVLDAFADEDTLHAAHEVRRVEYANGRFDAHSFMQALHALDLAKFDGLVYGGGFEAAPDLLEQAARHVPLIGNPPDVLRKLKQPRLFFSLLDELEIPHPQVSFEPPQHLAGWLLKHGGGSGGTHVQRLQDTYAFTDAYAYYQRESAGEPVSLLFAADGKEVRAVGFNTQWTAPTPAMPFRYGGAVSHAPLPQNVQQQLLRAAQLITAEVGLRGLNSVDALMQGDAIQLLEINPRLSATFDLYHDENCNLFDLHLTACAGDLSRWPQIPKRAKAQHIVYAPQDYVIPPLAWPPWAADLPTTGSVVSAGNPLCSVTAAGDDAQQARTSALARAQALMRLLSSNMAKRQKMKA